MGKQLDLLRKLIKEELDATLRNNTGADFNALEESEQLDEAAMYDIVNYLTDEELTEEDLDEARGRKKGTATKLILKQSRTKEEIADFLKKVKKAMDDKNNRTGMFKDYKGRGRKSNLFSDEDIKILADIISNPEGFDAMQIAKNVPYYANNKNPRNAAQKLMDVMGTEKETSDGKKIGKGYIEVMDSEKKVDKKEKEVVNTDTEEVSAAEFEDAADGKIDGIEDAEVKIDDTVEGGGELAQLKQQLASNMAILSPKIKQARETGNLKSYSEENKDLIAQNKELKADIERLEKEMAADLEVNEEDDMLNENLVHMFQKRAGLLNG